jgi:protein-L-isoaspartate(D-aspartate) O-methyltransferase
MNWFSLKIFELRFWFFMPPFFAFVMGCSAQNDDKFNGQRAQMVERQIKARGVTDKATLEACIKVSRHRFVLPQYINSAYSDSPLPIEEGQTISQPYIVAFMTEALNLKSTDKVLEIGTGSGYQAAILAEICDSVFTIEIFPKLTKKAQGIFNELGYKNIFCKTGDGYLGWPEHAPFDAIIVTCAPSKIPEPLQIQLAEGGQMIIPVDEYYGQMLVLLKKKNGKMREEKVLPVRFVPMINKDGKEY